jgi:hypothetical protein
LQGPEVFGRPGDEEEKCGEKYSGVLEIKKRMESFA